MTLYITADLATHYTIEAFGVSAIGQENFAAGQVVTNKGWGMAVMNPLWLIRILPGGLPVVPHAVFPLRY